VDGRKLSFSITADDGVDVISKGTHGRFIIHLKKFSKKANEKALRYGSG
jgi:fluoroacetyl-CoA thioesterase